MTFIQRYQPTLSWVSELDRLFDQSFRNPAFTLGPRETSHESDNAWILRLELPGFQNEDIELTTNDQPPQVVAESPADRPVSEKFEGQWRLGDEVDAAAIAAHLENGVFELTLPKKPQSVATSTLIPIE